MTDETSIDRLIGGNIRAVRNARKMSLREIASRLGVTNQQIQKYESGANRISVSVLVRIARLLNHPVAAFFDGIDGSDAESPRAVPVDKKDLRAARVLRRIEDPDLHQTLKTLIDLLGRDKA